MCGLNNSNQTVSEPGNALIKWRCQHVIGLQDVFNLLPNLGVEELTRAFAVKGNDMMLVIYLASLVRSVLALHNLLCNKVRWRLGLIGCGLSLPHVRMCLHAVAHMCIVRIPSMRCIAQCTQGAIVSPVGRHVARQARCQPSAESSTAGKGQLLITSQMHLLLAAASAALAQEWPGTDANKLPSAAAVHKPPCSTMQIQQCKLKLEVCCMRHQL